MPVLPEVGSTMVSPGLIRPSLSAFSTIGEADAVLDAAPGIVVFELGPDLGVVRSRQAIEPDHWGVTDQFQGRAGDTYRHKGITRCRALSCDLCGGNRSGFPNRIQVWAEPASKAGARTEPLTKPIIGPLAKPIIELVA